MPRWTYTIMLGDIFHRDDLGFEEKRDQIVARLERSQWYRVAGADSELGDLIGELREADTVTGFDEAWNELYELANYDRAWIDTVSQP